MEHPIVEIYPHYDERAKDAYPPSVIYADRWTLDGYVAVKGTMGEHWIPNILSQNFIKERWN